MTSRRRGMSAKMATVCFCCLVLLGGSVHPRFAGGAPTTSRSRNCNSTPPGTICVDYSQNSGAFPAAWEYVSNLSSSNGPISDQLIKNLRIKYSRMFYAAPIWSCGEGCYDFTAPENHQTGWGDDRQIDAIMAQGALPVLNIGGVPPWLGANVNGPPKDFDKYEALWTSALQHIATKYPTIYYLEAFNEPEYGKINSADVENMYSHLVSAVNKVYIKTRHHFLIGGPTSAVPLSSGVMRNFLSYVSSRHLELDFVSYHDYRGSGSGLGGFGRQIQQVLASVGLDPSLPQLVTEWAKGDSKSGWSNTVAVGDAVWIAQGWASTIAAGLGNIVQPEMTWENNCYIGDPNNSMFVTGPIGRIPDGTTCPGPDGPVMPAYNIYKMMSMQKADLVSYHGINDQVGLSPIASEDSTGVAFMITTAAGDRAKIDLINLPARFHHKSFTYREYLINPYTSNYVYNRTSAGSLQQVASARERAGTFFRTSVLLNRNSILLIVLTPA